MTEQTTATAEASTEPFDAAFITETARLAAETESRRQDLEDWLAGPVAKEWTAFLASTYARAGWKGARMERYQTGDTNGYWLSLSLTSEGAHWSGHDRDGDYDSFTIPWAFINPETRAVAKAEIGEDIRVEKEQRDALETAQQAERDARKRAQDEATLRDLAARLGKQIVDVDTED